MRAGAGADPDGFVAGLPVPVALDEAQRVPDLLLAVQAEIDEHRLLRAAFLVVDVPAWTTSLTTRIVRASKLFLIDSGLTAHLGIGRERVATEPHLAGGLLVCPARPNVG